MKKVFTAMACAMLLCGCGNQQADLPERVFHQLEGIKEQNLSVGSNQTKRYYSYYLPMGLGRRESNELSEVLMKDGYRIIMNFDPSSIVIQTYYEEESMDATTSPTKKEELEKQFQPPEMKQEGNKVVYKGNYLTSGHQVFPYTLQLVTGDDMILVYFDGTIVKLYTYIPPVAVPSFLKAMMTLASSIDYEKEQILQDYSLKSLNHTAKQSLDYLEQHLPSSGSLEELLHPDDSKIEGDMPQQEE